MRYQLAQGPEQLARSAHGCQRRLVAERVGVGGERLVVVERQAGQRHQILHAHGVVLGGVGGGRFSGREGESQRGRHGRP